MRRATLLPTFIASLIGAMGCYGGSVTDTLDSLADHNLSGVAGPPDLGAVQPVERIPRSLFGSTNDAQGLTFASLSEAARTSLFDAAEPASPLHFFVTARDANDGLGPMFNQTRCVGCHDNAADNSTIGEDQDVGAVLTINTSMSRGARTAVTDHERIGESPSSSAFTIFGDYYVAESRFDPLELFGGPVRHLGAASGCFPDPLPETPLAEGQALRAVGERSAPSYVGRGLIEAIYSGDIEAQADAEDRISSTSTLVPAPGCASDCISGRSVLNSADRAFIGGDPLLRIGRFGLRATGVTLLEVVAAGAQRDIGLTHPFLPTEEQNPYNAGLACDVAPDPELTALEILDLRDFIRNLAPPELAPELLDASADDDASRDVRAGAQLFGLDLDAFRSRLIDGAEPTGFGDEHADRGIAIDRQLNCVGCHTPIMVTGRSPASVGGEQLSNRWVPLFSDLLVHDMGTFPLAVDDAALESSHPFFRGLSRNLADYALEENHGADVYGIVRGSEWRTAPLLAFGKIGPPYLHDARVFLNPSAPAYFYYGSRTADEAQLDLEGRRVEITDIDSAIRAAIELHDLPQPPDTDLDGLPDYDACPSLEPNIDWCSRQSPLRSEARNVMEKWHGLGDVQQAQVIAFLKAL